MGGNKGDIGHFWLLAVLMAITIAGFGQASAVPVTLPPVDAVPDYQLGAAYPPPARVTVVARDRTAEAPRGMYAICYVNGFQTQPGELGAWPPAVLLRNSDGSTVHDPDWPDETLLDTRTPQQRAMIVGVVTKWIASCAESGYNAVEFDNLDSYTRAHVLRQEDAVALARDLVAAAHDAGLAAAQKNAAEDSSTLRTAGFDFAVAEECAAYDECASYTDVYGDHVIDIEYTDNLPRPFAAICADPLTPKSVVLRDRNLVASGGPGYHFEVCPR